MDVSAETILVAIVSGLGGGLIGTWLQIRHEREETFRERQITAADDLATGLIQAIIGLENAYSTCLRHGYFDAQNRLTLRDPKTGEVARETDEALSQSRGLISAARARTARVGLLFGPVSAPDRCATLALIHLEETWRALDGWPVPDLDKYREEIAGARKYLSEFNQAALREMKAPLVVGPLAQAAAPPPHAPVCKTASDVSQVTRWSPTG
jgi:hypothetical protein